MELRVKDDNGNDLPKTIISREYSSEWKPGDEPYYPVNDAKNSAAELINEEIRNFDIAIAQAEMEQTKNAEEREKETQTLVVAMQKLQELYIA